MTDSAPDTSQQRAAVDPEARDSLVVATASTATADLDSLTVAPASELSL